MNRLPEPFTHLDNAIANRVCRWLSSDDAVLWHSIAATSFALSQGHSCLAIDFAAREEPYNQLADVFPEPGTWLASLQTFAIGPEDNAPVVLDNRRLYLRRYWQFEQELARFFHDRFMQAQALTEEELTKVKRLLKDLFPQKTSDTDWQQIAAMNCVFSSTSLITGGPGTGKTYTVTRILALLASLHSGRPFRIRLAAPTGKAAQRLGEAVTSAKQELTPGMGIADCIPDSAQTLHRLLGVIPDRIHFRHNENNPIDADVLLIDEVSMVDLPLMTRLCRAIRPETRLILLGDADQLPSVAAGSVLADLIMRPHPGFSAERISQFKKLDAGIALTPAKKPLDYATELLHSRRFDSGSGIGQLAKHVISGLPDSRPIFMRNKDLNWYNEDRLDPLIGQWTTRYYASLPQRKNLKDAFTQLKAFRILCATREDDRGVKRINQRIQTRLNVHRRPFYRGQPIMVTQNHYRLKLFNGDIGLVWPNEAGDLMAWFESGEDYRAVALGRLPAVETVYAMTIHKTQGSEFDHVAMILPRSESQLLCRELLYTGLTRAKQEFSCVGRASVWEHGVEMRVLRWSGLASKTTGVY